MTINYIIANIIGISVLIFNVFVCFKIMKSNIENKIFKIALVIFLNLPTLVIYNSTGWSFNLFQLQICGYGNNIFQLGFRMFFSFSESHFSDPFVYISFPFGAIFVLYKLESWIRNKEYNDEGI